MIAPADLDAMPDHPILPVHVEDVPDDQRVGVLPPQDYRIELISRGAYLEYAVLRWRQQHAGLLNTRRPQVSDADFPEVARNATTLAQLPDDKVEELFWECWAWPLERSEAQADFDEWMQDPVWMISEIAALTLGVEPDAVAKAQTHGNLGQREYQIESRQRLVKRAALIGDIRTAEEPAIPGQQHAAPRAVVAWVKRHNVDCPEQFWTAVRRHLDLCKGPTRSAAQRITETDFDRAPVDHASSRAIIARDEEAKVAESSQPKQTAAAEADCRRWLIVEMKESPGRKPNTRGAYQAKAQELFPGLSRKAFGRAWGSAIAATNYPAWKKSGPIPRG